jgi:ATP-dependent protease Clp ATPase subunit
MESGLGQEGCSICETIVLEAMYEVPSNSDMKRISLTKNMLKINLQEDGYFESSLV